MSRTLRSTRATSLLLAGAVAFTAALALRAQQSPPLQPPPQQPPTVYVRLAPVTARGLAPGMQGQELPTAASRTFKVTFGQGDELLSGLTEFAEKHHITAAHITGLGGLSAGTLGWDDPAQRAMKKIVVDQKCEIASLAGNISAPDGKPRVHLHAVVSFSDGSTRGGHLLDARVAPYAEIYIITTDAPPAAKPAP